MKVKVLLVFEEYTDLIQAESALKKLGFDVIGLTNEYSVSEKLLAFNPDLVIAVGSGIRVNVLNIGRKLKEMKRWEGKSVLCFTGGERPTPKDLLQIRSDHIFEGSVSPARLVEMIIQIMDIKDDTLVEKLNKFSMQAQTANESVSLVSYNEQKEKKVYVTGNVNNERVKSSSVGGSSGHIENKATELFSSVDVNEIEKELYEGKISAQQIPLDKVVPSNSGIVTESDPNEELISLSIDEKTKVNIQSELADLENAKKNVSGKMLKYQKQVEPLRGMVLKNINRVESRKRQRVIAKEWDKKILEDLDQQRREYVKALFKK